MKINTKNSILVCLCILLASAGICFTETAPLSDRTDIVSKIENKEFTIKSFKFPLPEKYKSSVSSEQGLRDSISDVNAVGGATMSTYHNAIDFAVPDKTKVYAAKDGVIKTVYPGFYNGPVWKGHPTYGGLIEIKHDDNTISLYAHLSLTSVKEGDLVKEGDCIGWSGGVKGRRASGNSTGPHLHFAVYLDISSVFD